MPPEIAQLVGEAVITALKMISFKKSGNNFSSFVSTNEKDEIKLYSSGYLEEMRKYYEIVNREFNENEEKQQHTVLIESSDKNMQLAWYSILGISRGGRSFKLYF